MTEQNLLNQLIDTSNRLHDREDRMLKAVALLWSGDTSAAVEMLQFSRDVKDTWEGRRSVENEEFIWDDTSSEADLVCAGIESFSMYRE